MVTGVKGNKERVGSESIENGMFVCVIFIDEICLLIIYMKLPTNKFHV